VAERSDFGTGFMNGKQRCHARQHNPHYPQLRNERSPLVRLAIGDTISLQANEASQAKAADNRERAAVEPGSESEPDAEAEMVAT
jgi:hypothetical protein